MSTRSPARWLGPIAAAVASAAAAQPAPVPAPVPAVGVPAYQSAFEGYQAFADEKPIAWQQANETVRQRGGWKAYAREAQGAGGADAHGAHGGHGSHTPPAPAAAAPAPKVPQ